MARDEVQLRTNGEGDVDMIAAIDASVLDLKRAVARFDQHYLDNKKNGGSTSL
jgi:hypothetical protein